MDGREMPGGGADPGLTFEGLVMLFGTAGLVHLGGAPDPAGGERRVDLVQVRHAIAALEVLKEKTAGNLSPGEAALVDGILFDLRCRYVDAAKNR